MMYLEYPHVIISERAPPKMREGTIPRSFHQRRIRSTGSMPQAEEIILSLASLP
jgi:hypothetical protein